MAQYFQDWRITYNILSLSFIDSDFLNIINAFIKVDLISINISIDNEQYCQWN